MEKNGSVGACEHIARSFLNDKIEKSKQGKENALKKKIKNRLPTSDVTSGYKRYQNTAA